MKWLFKIDNSVDLNKGTLYNESNNVLGVVQLFELKDFLKFLSVLPRNRIKITGIEVLQKKGVPFVVTEYGKISNRATVRGLMKKGYMPREICEITGLDEKTVDQNYSHINKER